MIPGPRQLQRLARRLQPLQRLLPALALVCLSLVAALLLNGDHTLSDRYLTPLLLLLLWLTALYALIHTFQYLHWPPPEGARLGQKIRAALLGLWQALLAALFLIATLALTLLSWRLLALWHHDY
ncbi:MAG: hypothetical protein B0D96_08090 [Candidatus Sedimenticola endophacoides]|uniref:Uncharacterized protein n=1 Tax=Candidatus Sedimenticola endophacoides TaxID=2548426 RepID=A0A657Q460_9GAMM|nr:MAG: hypothetical protein B0D94_11650 [Candidatus Sedimenticola endophacoides]OQX34950.1 MAG: hypothetical protein B0D96_08090 [Candidatus Sedimenticola endophacoides]OQX40528.1 MAG: hypothetical protein B0D89_07430 [Candidatus Sedimenticola endophacoides]OQX44950.1 MAG: hypothetical protein B0D88_01410 [Candidatus Sedimenticola endophacoides]OQX45163.1 MAG: hypothetical protein B0D86_04140 [Candidatus Sedimenticola endophacoides]